MYFDYWIKKKVRSDTMLGGPKKLQTMKMLSLGHQLMFFSSCCSWPSSSFCLILLSVHLFRCLVMLIHSVANPWTIDCSGSSLKWDSPGKNTGVGCHFLLSPRDRTQVCLGRNKSVSPALQVYSLQLSHPGRRRLHIYTLSEACQSPLFFLPINTGYSWPRSISFPFLV